MAPVGAAQQGGEDLTVTVHVGDARDVLRGMDADSVHCVVTSPPYWGLRAYKGDHGMIGMEPTFEAHVENLVSVFEEVRRVLRPDGTLWLNYGDAYWSNPSNGRGAAGSALGGGEPHLSGAERKGKWLKAKDLMLMPARVAMALQEAGWWLRSEIIWHKPNPMPESVTDRPTCAHEKVFLFSKAPRYFYDAEAVRVPYQPVSLADKRTRADGRREKRDPVQAPDMSSTNLGENKHGGANLRNVMTADEDYEGVAPGASRRPPKGGQAEWDATGRTDANIRNVWKIATAPYKGAHFATFPPAIVEPCIKAGTSKHGVCSECGAPWAREVEKEFVPTQASVMTADRASENGWTGTPKGVNRIETTGWRPTCECNAETVPAVVLDCFGGAGTVGLVADRLQRDAVLIEISEDYAGMARKRIEKDAGMFASIASRMTAKGKG